MLPKSESATSIAASTISQRTISKSFWVTENVDSLWSRVMAASSAETRFWEAPNASFFFMSQLLVVRIAHPQKLAKGYGGLRECEPEMPGSEHKMLTKLEPSREYLGQGKAYGEVHRR